MAAVIPIRDDMVPAAGGAKGEVARATSPSGAPLKTAVLPNGIEFSYPGLKDEVDFVFNEIFEDDLYTSRGVSLHPGGTVLDLGANAGMFALFASQGVGPKGRVIAVEPTPQTAACLAFNIASHERWAAANGRDAAPIELMQAACSDGSQRKLRLTMYKNFSVLNSTVPNYKGAHTGLKTYIYNLMLEGKAGGNWAQRKLMGLGAWVAKLGKPGRGLVKFVLHGYIHLLLIAKDTVEVDMVTLSEIIAQKNISRVDLLKVDVERAELQVLRGVKHEDWPKIQQFAAEVHHETIEGVKAILEGPAAFDRVIVEANGQVGLYAVWAYRVEP